MQTTVPKLSIGLTTAFFLIFLLVPTVGFNICVLGASGNVGSAVVRSLSNSNAVQNVLLLNRREVPLLTGLPKVKSVIVDMDKIEVEAEKHCGSCHALIITTGLGASSKHTKEELIRVDIELPTSASQGARRAGVQHVALLSAVGSDINAKESFFTGTAAGGGLYNHVKGQIEANLIGHKYTSTNIFRPAAILGNSHTPFWLKLFQMDFLGKFKSIDQDVLGNAIVQGTLKSLSGVSSGVNAYQGAELFQLGNQVGKSKEL